jgi:hypothetical protein
MLENSIVHDLCSANTAGGAGAGITTAVELHSRQCRLNLPRGAAAPLLSGCWLRLIRAAPPNLLQVTRQPRHSGDRRTLSAAVAAPYLCLNWLFGHLAQL